MENVGVEPGRPVGPLGSVGHVGPVGRVGAEDVELAVQEAVRVLGEHTEADWGVPAGPVEWSCLATAAHIAHDLVAYAGQLAGRAEDGYLPFDLTVRPAAEPDELLRVVAACGALLSTVIRAARPDDRAWHWGPTDPGGFAAMGVAEVLLHTHDISRGLGVPWSPPTELCERVLARLFQDAPAGEPVAVLLWCTGRAALGDLPRRTSWTWRASIAE